MLNLKDTDPITFTEGLVLHQLKGITAAVKGLMSLSGELARSS